MIFGAKTIGEIDENDLLRLIGTSNESQAVDFKEFAYPSPPEDRLPNDERERNIARNKWKLDLCKDLSAFANAAGGWIICGMKEKGGIATELCGLGVSVDGERVIARLEQCANSGIEPAISGLSFRIIQLQDEARSKVMLIYIPQSFRAPHRVKEISKFHIRRSNRNDEMTVDELRRAFNLSESLSERIKNFRKERVEAIDVNSEHEDLPVLLESGPYLILHSVPLAFSDIGSAVHLRSRKFANDAFEDDGQRDYFMQYASFNIDGLVMPAPPNKDNLCEDYFQVYRSGVIEYVQARFEYSEKLIPLNELENETLGKLSIALKMQRNLGIEPPLIIMLSLLGVKGYRLKPIPTYRVEPRPLRQNVLLIPDIVFEDYGSDIKIVIRHVFDILWNAGGFNRSDSYDSDGNWIRRLERS